jgi:signal transduction histidine kinase
MTLRWRLTYLYVGVSAAIFAAALLAVDSVYRMGVTASVDRSLVQSLDDLAEGVDGTSHAEPSRLRAALSQFARQHESLFYMVRDAEGNILIQSDPDLPGLSDMLPASVLPATKPAFRTLQIGSHYEVRLGAMSVGTDGFRIAVGRSLPQGRNVFSSWASYWILVFGLVLIGTLGWSGWLIAGRALAPIDQITETARSVSQGALEERIPVPRSKDELGRLVSVLNSMLDRIEHATRKLRHFASNVSHQLRTPLTVLRGEIEVALKGKLSPAETRELLGSNLVELEKLSELVADLLAYARTEDGGTAAGTAQRLDVFAQELVRKGEILCQSKNLRLSALLSPVTAVFHAGRLEQAALNVLDNAVRHTPEGGTVSLMTGRADSRAFLRVQDTGPGVSQDDLALLFQRGRSQSGTGIGLSLAKALVESFGASVEVESAVGAGLQVTLWLPT